MILKEKKTSLFLDVALGTPLALGDFAKYCRPLKALIEQLIDDFILSFSFKVFKRVL